MYVAIWVLIDWASAIQLQHADWVHATYWITIYIYNEGHIYAVATIDIAEDQCLHAYCLLAEKAAMLQRPLFPIKPKLHAVCLI